jgi:hypothetical protein
MADMPTDALRLVRAARDRLASGRDALLPLLYAMSGEAAQWRPRPGAWSSLEIANHLADEERDDFRARLARTLDDPQAPWEPIDPEAWVTSRRYGERDMQASIDRFSVERDVSLHWLSELEEPDLSLAHVHPLAGPIRAGDLLAAWVAHDLFHVRQLVRLHYRHLSEAFPGFDPAYAGAWGGR